MAGLCLPNPSQSLRHRPLAALLSTTELSCSGALTCVGLLTPLRKARTLPAHPTQRDAALPRAEEGACCRTGPVSAWELPCLRPFWIPLLGINYSYHRPNFFKLPLLAFFLLICKSAFYINLSIMGVVGSSSQSIVYFDTVPPSTQGVQDRQRSGNLSGHGAGADLTVNFVWQ